MTWCLGWIVLFSFDSTAAACGHSKEWQWYAMLVLWFLVGVGALAVALVRIVSAKVKAGTLTPSGTRPSVVPAAKDED